MNEALKTLFHPFETGSLENPAANDRVLFLDVEADRSLPMDFPKPAFCVQPSRPAYLAAKGYGWTVEPRLSEGTFDAALILGGRYRGRSEARVAEALRAVKEGGLIVVAASKDDGAQSLRKRIAQLVEIEGSEPKYHGIAFWFRRPVACEAAVEQLQAATAEIPGTGGMKAPVGVFSHDRIDVGSKLLVAHLPELKGRVADYGAGWGYLSAHALKVSGKITHLDLYEADFEALEAARANLDEQASEAELSLKWLDLTREEISGIYDAVIMNPPFHKGRAAEPSLGQAFIKKAAARLRPGGRLYMVANRQLPYEAVLQQAFGNYTQLADQAGFKVLTARR
ncbi:class I SAM-dependent methyltransferase [Limoniibacter endophyticus]|uniref:Methyltransferase n=1 Tax=Limoniibacter endophyticus TaxID=1565040 RepID=A0A8J3DIC1_9HYPH|nr:class I SAM-dependent methyltransferase [Limoniibacter endophyticus]GHC69792.1 methyltransferase [Limoniibacter endophyticus]